MSIRTYFENISDAIRVTSGSDDTYTPAEMPQAIRNLSSIFQTKTLSSPIGGQTTVEGCLSSLSSDLSELNSNKADFIQAFSSATDTVYQGTSSNTYIVPETGWYRMIVRNDAFIQISGQTILFANANELGQMMLPLKRGAVLGCYGNATGAYISITKFISNM